MRSLALDISLTSHDGIIVDDAGISSATCTLFGSSLSTKTPITILKARRAGPASIVSSTTEPGILPAQAAQTARAPSLLLPQHLPYLVQASGHQSAASSGRRIKARPRVSVQAYLEIGTGAHSNEYISANSFRHYLSSTTWHPNTHKASEEGHIFIALHAEYQYPR